jgi:hypothetical protein
MLQCKKILLNLLTGCNPSPTFITKVVVPGCNMRLKVRSRLKNIEVKQEYFPLNKDFKQLCWIYLPHNTEELDEILLHAQSEGLEVKFIKQGTLKLSSKPIKQGTMLIDLTYLDKIIKFDMHSGYLHFQSGLVANQLQQFLINKKELALLPPSISLLNDFMHEYLQKAENDEEVNSSYKYYIEKKHTECCHRTFIASFDSIATLFNIYPELRSLKNELGYLIRDIFIINQQHTPRLLENLQDEVMTKHCLFKMQKAFTKFQWHLVIEVESPLKIISFIQKVINQVLKNSVHYSLYLDHRKSFFSMPFTKINSQQGKAEQQSIKFTNTCENKPSLLIRNYHTIYTHAKKLQQTPAILFDLNDDFKLTINVKSEYRQGNEQQKQISSQYIASLLSSIK